MPLSTPLRTSSSAARRTAPGITSAIDFMTLPALPQVRRMVSVGWTMCIPTIRTRPWRTGCTALNRGQTTKRSIASGPKTATYRWFRARAVPIRDDGKIVKWYGTCSDIHDSKLLEQSIRDNATELEKMVDRRTDELRRLSIRLMTMQDQERRRIARDLHDGLGQELAVAKMVLDRMILQKSARTAGRSVDSGQQHYRSCHSASPHHVSSFASTVAR